ncbi:hypothetical protein TYRP_012487, partial [Tyrophagus putrescentiae]
MGRYSSLPVFDASYEIQSVIRRRRPSPTSRPALWPRTSVRLAHHDSGPASTPSTLSSGWLGLGLLASKRRGLSPSHRCHQKRRQSTRIERLEPISISKIAPVIGSFVQELATPEVDDVTDIFQLTEKQLLKCGAKQLMETSNEEDDELAQTDKTDDVQIESTAKVHNRLSIVHLISPKSSSDYRDSVARQSNTDAETIDPEFVPFNTDSFFVDETTSSSASTPTSSTGQNSNPT